MRNIAFTAIGWLVPVLTVIVSNSAQAQLTFPKKIATTSDVIREIRSLSEVKLRPDAAVYYRTGRLSIALNLKNLSNVRYFTPRTITLVYPEDPFTVQGTVSWKF